MGILVDGAFGVLVLDVVALDFVVVEDDLGGLLDAVGRVARVAVRGGMRWKWSASRVCLSLFGYERSTHAFFAASFGCG